MNSIIGWIALGLAVLLVIWVATSGNGAQAACEQTHSRDVCFMTLNP